MTEFRRFEVLPVFIREYLGPATVLGQTADLVHLAESMSYELRAGLLADKLPPQRVTHRVNDTHTVTFPRTWWDHFKAAYRRRWWMRWRDWHVEHEQHHYTCDHKVVVDIEGHWTYPEATVPLPQDFGNGVYVAIVNGPRLVR